MSRDIIHSIQPLEAFVREHCRTAVGNDHQRFTSHALFSVKHTDK